MSDYKYKLEDLKRKSKERSVKSLSYDINLETLISKIKKGIIKLNPDYQRRHRWNQESSSKLIESLILNIPVPIIFISQDIDTDEDLSFASEDARYTVIDGQQRLTAISTFLSNDYELSSLKVLNDLNGAKYSDLPQFLQRRLEERTVKIMEIDSTVDEDVKYDIFERINTGSVRLEAQEIRNCVYRGHFNTMIKELASSNYYLSLINLDPTDLQNEKRYQKMEDVELVLRFFALQHFEEFKSNFKGFLDSKQKQFNEVEDKVLTDMKKTFVNTLRFIEKINIKYPFSKWNPQGSQTSPSSYFNAAVFDAVMVGIAKSADITHLSDTDKINETTLKKLFEDPQFFDAVDVSTNRPEAIKYRIEKIQSLF